MRARIGKRVILDTTYAQLLFEDERHPWRVVPKDALPAPLAGPAAADDIDGRWGLVGEADYIAAQEVNATGGPSPQTGLGGPEKRRYLLAGLFKCGVCGRRMESAWSNGKPAYLCRHGHTTASLPDPDRPKKAHVREDRILPRLAALYLLLTEPAGEPRRRRRTWRGADVQYQIDGATRLPFPSPRRFAVP